MTPFLKGSRAQKRKKDTLVSHKQWLVLTFADTLVVQNTKNFIRTAPGNTGIGKQARCARALFYVAQNEKARQGGYK